VRIARRNGWRSKRCKITIIEGNGASQYGVGMVAARVAGAMLRDERGVFPVGLPGTGRLRRLFGGGRGVGAALNRGSGQNRFG